MHVSGLWDEARGLREKPYRHGENMQALLRKVQEWIQTHDLLAARRVLITAPPNLKVDLCEVIP